MKYYVIFGPPGAGKGTQSVPMVDEYNLCHISTGDLLRSEIEKGSELGRKAAELINAGNFVPDEVVEGMILSKFDNPEPGVEGFLLDGFPRTLSQAKDLDVILESRGEYVTGTIYLHISDELVHERIRHRANIEGRVDDADPVIIENRIRTYHEKTEPIVDFYKKKGNFFEIDGDGGAGQEGIGIVFGRVKKIMDMLHRNRYFQMAWEYLRNNNLSELEPGRHDIDEGNVWVNVVSGNLKKVEDAKMETHDSFIDIQVPISCPEGFGVRKREDCVTPYAAYDEAKDITFYKDAPSEILTIQPNQPVIFTPDDGHAPMIGEGPILKAIFKVRV